MKFQDCPRWFVSFIFLASCMGSVDATGVTEGEEESEPGDQDSVKDDSDQPDAASAEPSVRLDAAPTVKLDAASTVKLDAAVNTGGKGGAGSVSPMGGNGGTAAASQGEAAGASTGGAGAGARVPAIVAVGYGGLRIVSRDNGKTWANRQILAPQGGDDENLLRGVGWGDGLFIAVGWKLFTSEDGVTWVERKKSGLHDCVSFKNGAFYIKNLRGGDTRVSNDRGVTWAETRESINCVSHFDSFDVDGVHLETVWQGGIERSESGKKAVKVYQDTQENHPNGFNSGFASP